jgi:hypothetical protein
MNLDAAAAVIVARLNDGGVRATVDERDINPPAVWVKPPQLSFRFGKGWTADWTLTACVPDTGRDVALGALGRLVTAVQETMNWAVVTGLPVSLIVPGGSAPLPAYELTFSERIQP